MFLIIIGMTIYAVAIPIANQIVELICTAIDCLKLKLHCNIAKSQKEIEQLSVDENTVSHSIGFQIPAEEEFYDEDDE